LCLVPQHFVLVPLQSQCSVLLRLQRFVSLYALCLVPLQPQRLVLVPLQSQRLVLVPLQSQRLVPLQSQRFVLLPATDHEGLALPCWRRKWSDWLYFHRRLSSLVCELEGGRATGQLGLMAPVRLTIPAFVYVVGHNPVWNRSLRLFLFFLQEC